MRMILNSIWTCRQILGVPLRHPLTGEAVGLLQVNNRLAEAGQGQGQGSGPGLGQGGCFSAEEQRILELAAEQLSELLHGREDVFLQTTGASAAASSSSASSSAAASSAFPSSSSAAILPSSSSAAKKSFGQGAGDGNLPYPIPPFLPCVRPDLT